MHTLRGWDVLCPGLSRAIIAVSLVSCVRPNVKFAAGLSGPQGEGPQDLWPTPALTLWDAETERLSEPLAAHVRRLAVKALNLSRGSNDLVLDWKSASTQFLQDCIGSRGGSVAVAAQVVHHFIKESLQRYLRMSLGGKVSGVADAVVKQSWVSLTSSAQVGQAPHVHARSSLSGTYYVSCGIGVGAFGPALCSTSLEDPRAPAAGSDMPPILRKRLGFGVKQAFDLRPGSILIFPSWLVHEASPSQHAEGDRIAISFTADVRHSSSGGKASNSRTLEDPSMRDLDDEL